MHIKTILLAPVIALLAVVASGHVVGQSGQLSKSVAQERGEDAFPVVAIDDTPETADAESKELRKIRGRKYDNWKVVNERTKKGITIISEVEYPALPVIDSDAVVAGEVTDARAYLSNDKGGVYSELVIRVDEVFKPGGQPPVTVGQVVAGERHGGRVKFPTGEVGKFSIDSRGMPRQGRKYLLFLRRNAEGESYMILTAYELLEGKVYPVDGSVAAVGKNRVWPFDTYKGADRTRLIGDLQKEIANPSQKVKVF